MSSSLMTGLVLAAGQSRRMGSPKLTLPWRNGRTVVESVVAALREGGLTEIVVVVGGDRQAVEEALAEARVGFVENPDFATGDMLSSIQAGLRALGEAATAAVLTPGDLPDLQGASVRAVVEAWRRAPDELCAPVYRGRRGHPVVLPRGTWAEVLALGPGESLRSFLRGRAEQIRLVEVQDPGIHADVDTPQDYRAAR